MDFMLWHDLTYNPQFNDRLCVIMLAMCLPAAMTIVLLQCSRPKAYPKPTRNQCLGFSASALLVSAASFGVLMLYGIPAVRYNLHVLWQLHAVFGSYWGYVGCVATIFMIVSPLFTVPAFTSALFPNDSQREADFAEYLLMQRRRDLARAHYWHS